MEAWSKRKRVLGAGRFLILRELEYDNGSGPRLWEACDRSGTGSAVFILARIVPDDEIVLIRQFRPPAGRQILEFPAGLMDPGESAEQTAMRELFEETGYRGRVIGCGRPGWSSPGLSGETICMVQMEIDGNSCRGKKIEPHPEENERIEVFRVRRSNLAEFVASQEACNVGIDTKIYTYLSGMAGGGCIPQVAR